jgi:hypothetical protein
MAAAIILIRYGSDVGTASCNGTAMFFFELLESVNQNDRCRKIEYSRQTLGND